jgi:1-deoxy-D-xylulose-5-phosphate synthase
MLVGVDRGGLVGQDGETHHGIYDVAFLKSIPNSTIAMPSDIDEMQKLVRLGFNNGMFFLRYPRGKAIEMQLIKNQDIKIGQWDYVGQIKEANTTLIVTGPIIHQVVETFKDLDINIVYARFYNPIDEKMLDNIKGNIIVYDIYSTNLGLFNSIAAYCALKKLDIRLHDFSLKNIFYPHGSIDDLLIRYKLDLKNLQTEVEKIIKHT